MGRGGKGAHLGEGRGTAGWDSRDGRGRGGQGWEGLGRREPAEWDCTRREAQLDGGGGSIWGDEARLRTRGHV